MYVTSAMNSMIYHFYAMAGAIPYARTALKAVGADIKAVLTPGEDVISGLERELAVDLLLRCRDVLPSDFPLSDARGSSAPDLALIETPPGLCNPLGPPDCVLGLEALVSQARQDLPAALLPIGPP